MRVEDFAKLADKKDPHIIEKVFGDPFEFCVTGLCVTVANETKN